MGLFESLGVGAVIFFAIAILVVAAIVLAVLSRSWIKVARADEALVISGRKSKDDDGNDTNVQVVVHGKAIVNPITQRYEVMSLRSRKLSITTKAQSGDNISLEVEAVALVKISSDKNLVRAAAERFASQDKEVEVFTTEQLEGALRGVVSRLKVQDLLRDRQKFSDEIGESISEELRNQGLILDSFQIQDIDDKDGYIKSLGVPQIQEKWREAEIAKTQTEREVTERRISTEEENLIERTEYEANQQKASARVGEESARARQAELLAEAKAEQDVLEQQIQNEKRRLEADVNAKADSDLYKRQKAAEAKAIEEEKQAEAQYKVAERKAQADLVIAQQNAEAVKASAEAEAHRERSIGLAKAEASKAEADAIAHAEREIGLAKAEAIRVEAEAIKENQEAYIASKAIEVLPALMESFSKGYSAIDNYTVIGGNGEIGSASSQMSSESVGSISAMMSLMKDQFGIDLSALINSSAQGRAFGNALEDARGNAGSNVEGLGSSSAHDEN